MSYMGLPRVTIAGSFYTDPSTVDNDPSHYDESCTNPSPWQDPGGSHFFSFQDILSGQTANRAFTAPTVTAVIDENGNVVLTDKLVGAAVNSMDTPGGIPNGPFSPAKMIDIDVYQQAVSSIHGFFLKIGFEGISGATTLVGAMDPCSLNSCRFDRVLPTRGWQPWDSYGQDSFGGDTNASGVFQSVLRVPAASWTTNSGSAVLDQLRTKCSQDSAGNLLLSIRMTLDGYQNVSYHPEDFRLGRMAATIGPLLAGDPSQCVAGRWLPGRAYFGGTKAKNYQDADPWNQPSLYGAPFFINQRTSGAFVTIDLSNAITMATPGGPPLDLGNLSLYVGDGSTGVVGAPFQLNDIFYSLGGGVVDLALSEAQAQAAASAPFFLVTSRTDLNGIGAPFNGLPILWQESSTGTWIACNDRNFQLASDQPFQTSAPSLVYMTQWGQPVTDITKLQVGVFPCLQGCGPATVPWSAGYLGNPPSSEGALSYTVTAGAPGKFQILFTPAFDPGARTPELDSMLYFVCAWPTGTPAPANNLNTNCPPQEQMISVVIWQSYTLNTAAAFPEIQQIMKVYDKLFPAMHAKMDLMDEQTFFTFAINPPWFVYYANTPGPTKITLPNGGTIACGSIPYYLTRNAEDPRLMPIMRNLSPNKLLTVLYYCWNLQQQTQPTPPPPHGDQPAVSGPGAGNPHLPPTQNAGK